MRGVTLFIGLGWFRGLALTNRRRIIRRRCEVHRRAVRGGTAAYVVSEQTLDQTCMRTVLVRTLECASDPSTVTEIQTGPSERVA